MQQWMTRKTTICPPRFRMRIFRSPKQSINSLTISRMISVHLLSVLRLNGPSWINNRNKRSTTPSHHTKSSRLLQPHRCRRWLLSLHPRRLVNVHHCSWKRATHLNARLIDQAQSTNVRAISRHKLQLNVSVANYLISTPFHRIYQRNQCLSTLHHGMATWKWTRALRRKMLHQPST